MHLRGLSLIGFKSFAKRTVLEFPPPKNRGRKGITVIVGPNGSGKSNIADAIRWALGEQSLKQLRGKKAEDVIFAGSDVKSRLGLAEVSIDLDNTDGTADIDMSELVVMRRIDRSGESEYLVNNKKARLQDIAILLARAHFGTRTYSVIGQGMIDHFLVASPEERKEFFDEATGVKEFQIKRHDAVLKLNRTEENLREAEMLMQEIEPHLRGLKRQVSRLEKREAVAQELNEVRRQYFGVVWHDLARQHKLQQKEYFALEGTRTAVQREYEALEKKLREIEKKETTREDVRLLQRRFEELTKQDNELRLKLIKAQSDMEIARVKAQAGRGWQALPLPEIVSAVERVQAEVRAVKETLCAIKAVEEVPGVLQRIEAVEGMTVRLMKGLKRPLAEVSAKVTEEFIKEIEVSKAALVALQKELHEVRETLHASERTSEEGRRAFFELQRAMQGKQATLREFDEKLGVLRVELAKIDTRREDVEEEMRRELGSGAASVRQGSFEGDAPSVEPIRSRMYELKSKLEMIGGIDEEVVKEYKEVESRYTFLENQVNDLKKAIGDLYTVLDELDATMKERRDGALKEINKEFERFFKLLFNGGRAELIPLFEEEMEEGEAGEGQGAHKESAAPDASLPREKQKSARKGALKLWSGVDIKAIPPGKRITNINTLSGGERAMTAIALICAIISVNPAPFVVLDEVDAALDEANSLRFAMILKELSSKTQFICITHNRATMQYADVLYGVTMGSDGVSNLLSVRLEEAVEQAAR